MNRLRIPLTGPRAVRLRENTQAGIVGVEIGLVVVLIGGNLLVDRYFAEAIELESRGVATKGRVTGFNGPELLYEYLVAGRRFTGSATVSKARQVTTKAGAEVTVVFGLGAISIGLRGAARRERSVLRDWPAIPATVVALHVRPKNEGQDAFTIYEVDLAFREGDEDRTIREEIDAFQATSLKEGVATFILHHPEEPSRRRLITDFRFVEPIGRYDA